MNAAASTQHKEQLQYLIINKPNSITMGDLTDFMILMGRAIATFMCVSKVTFEHSLPPSAFSSGSLQHNFRNAAAHQIYQ